MTTAPPPPASPGDGLPDADVAAGAVVMVHVLWASCHAGFVYCGSSGAAERPLLFPLQRALPSQGPVSRYRRLCSGFSRTRTRRKKG